MLLVCLPCGVINNDIVDNPLEVVQIIECSVRNYRSPSRHWRLTFRVGDHQLRLGRQKKKKKRKKKKEKRAVANLSQRRRADRKRAFFLPFFRFGLIENETRIAKLPPGTRGATEQYRLQCKACAAGTFHTCGCKIEKKEKKRHHVPIHNSKAIYVSFVATSRKKADGSRGTFFLSVSVRSRTSHGLRDSHLSRACWALQCIQFIFSKTLFDFKKSISGLIELKFSGKTPNEVLYAPIYFWGVYF